MPDHADAYSLSQRSSPPGCVLDTPATIVHIPLAELDDETLSDLREAHPEWHTDEHDAVPCLAAVAGWWCAPHDEEIDRDEELILDAMRVGSVEMVARE